MCFPMSLVSYVARKP